MSPARERAVTILAWRNEEPGQALYARIRSKIAMRRAFDENCLSEYMDLLNPEQPAPRDRFLKVAKWAGKWVLILAIASTIRLDADAREQAREAQRTRENGENRALIAWATATKR